jgi:hypothetical protein
MLVFQKIKINYRVPLDEWNSGTLEVFYARIAMAERSRVLIFITLYMTQTYIHIQIQE